MEGRGVIRSTSACGRAAIREALARAHGDGCEILTFSTIEKWQEGGPDPLDGFLVVSGFSPRPHWHYVSLGFTDLDEKEGDDIILSGYGFELSVRLERDSKASVPPPVAPMRMMQMLARYVFHSGNPFEIGDVIELGESQSRIASKNARALAFVLDSGLGQVRTPFGHLKFLQPVPIVGQDRNALSRSAEARSGCDSFILLAPDAFEWRYGEE